ncbi:unnamed protein product [Gongylonema pulchrum]|uniref:Nuclear receptor domain-containing protein n=1 Tax=Gongylonema pulchrum TaxID=637853 RepID=A0A183E0S3_9BILA|nr:unnamed protein product [Gongylonema pulchrum]
MASARRSAEECHHNYKCDSARAGGPYCLSVQCAHCRELRQGALKRCCGKQKPLCDDPERARIMASARRSVEECHHNYKCDSARAGGPHCLSVQCAHCRELRQGALKRCCGKQK